MSKKLKYGIFFLLCVCGCVNGLPFSEAHTVAALTETQRACLEDQIGINGAINLDGFSFQPYSSFSNLSGVNWACTDVDSVTSRSIAFAMDYTSGWSTSGGKSFINANVGISSTGDDIQLIGFDGAGYDAADFDPARTNYGGWLRIYHQSDSGSALPNSKSGTTPNISGTWIEDTKDITNGGDIGNTVFDLHPTGTTSVLGAYIDRGTVGGTGTKHIWRHDTNVAKLYISKENFFKNDGGLFHETVNGQKLVYRNMAYHRCFCGVYSSTPPKCNIAGGGCGYGTQKIYAFDPAIIPPPPAHFTGSASVTIPNGNQIKGSSYQVSYLLQIKRLAKQNNREKDGVATKWWATGTGGATSFYSQATAHKTSLMVPGERETVKNYTQNKSISPGQSIRTCQTLHYYASVQGEDFSDPRSSQSCVTASRNPAKFSGETHLADNPVPGATYDSASHTYIVPGDLVTVNYVHSIKRTNDGAGGSVSADYWLDYGGSGSTAGLNEGRQTQPFSSQHTVQLPWPGQVVEVCQRMKYTSEINYDYGDSYDYTDNVCVRVKRKPDNCSIDTDAGSQEVTMTTDATKNFASIRLQVGNTAGSPTKTATVNNLNTASASPKRLYVKPNQLVRFIHKGCAANQIRADAASAGTRSIYDFAGESNRLGPDSNAGATPSLQKYLFGSDFALPFINVVGNRLTQKITIGGQASYSDHYKLSKKSPSGAPFAPQANGPGDDLGSVITQEDAFNETSGGASRTLSVSVGIPYNYLIDVVVDSSGPGGADVANAPRLAGTNITTDFTVKPRPRVNPIVDADRYATAIKPHTEYEIVSWVEPATTTANDILSIFGNNDSRVKAPDPADADAVKNRGYIIGSTDSVGNPFRPSNRLDAGKTVTVASGFLAGQAEETISRQLPIPVETTPGAKFCFTVGLFPADSHDFYPTGSVDPSTSLTNASSQDPALRLGTTADSKWFVAAPTCYTIGKKPTFQATGAGVYAYNGAEGSVTKRRIDNSSTNVYFSSWSQYGLIGHGVIDGIASGASIRGGQTSNNPRCYFSALTMSNSNCDTGNLGKVSGLTPSTASSPLNFTNQVKTRYAMKKSSGDNLKDANGNDVKDLSQISDMLSILFGGDGSVTDINGYCVPVGNSQIAYVSAGEPHFSCMPNGYKYVYSSETFVYKGGESLQTVLAVLSNQTLAQLQSYFPDIRTDLIQNTTIIHAPKIIIDNDIQIFDYLSFENIRYLPQIIFVADEIVITEGVGHLDAWLVAPKITTCSPLGADKTIHNSVCSRPLTVNGPVMGSHLNLFRTAGGDIPGTLTIPAEHFDVGPEIYLWSYAQAGHYSQATTVFSRELPTRF